MKGGGGGGEGSWPAGQAFSFSAHKELIITRKAKNTGVSVTVFIKLTALGVYLTLDP